MTFSLQFFCNNSIIITATCIHVVHNLMYSSRSKFKIILFQLQTSRQCDYILNKLLILVTLDISVLQSNLESCKKLKSTNILRCLQ